MLTTKEVRKIIRKHTTGADIWTDKPVPHRSYTGTLRRVKCYFDNNGVLLRALQKAAGRDNVTVTRGNPYNRFDRGPGIVVKCLLG
jgi:hypothetical protein